jgi:OOP family OmpA-OmpF porin
MKKIAMAILLPVFIAAPAVASDMYVGVNVGSAKIDSPGFDTTTSFALLGGYTFNEYFAAELALINFGSKDYSTIFGPTTVKSSAWSLSGVGSYPINEQFSVFAKLGLASTTLEATGFPSTSKSDLTYGLGGQFNVNKQIGIRLGYDVYKVSDSVLTVDQKVTSIGAVFKF